MFQARRSKDVKFVSIDSKLLRTYWLIMNVDEVSRKHKTFRSRKWSQTVDFEDERDAEAFQNINRDLWQH